MADFWGSVASSSVALLILITIMGLVYTVWTRASLKKKRSYFKEIHTELVPGKEVMFCGGIFDKVQKVGEDRVEVQVKDGTVIEISRYAVQEIVSK